MTDTSPAPSLPPADLATRILPIKLLDARHHALLRIHSAHRDPVFYNTAVVSSTVFRFDAPAGEYGVLYAAEAFNTCMAETVVRDRFEEMLLPLVLTESELAQKAVSTLVFTPRPLRLADLTETCWQLGLTTQVLADPSYVVSNAWSLAIHSHPEQVDGVYFRSRYANAPSVALFSDRAQVARIGNAEPLLASPHLLPFLTRFIVDLRA